MTAPRRVLVAGAGGALGLEVVRALRARSADVIAAWRTKRDGLENEIAALGATSAQWDLNDADRGRDLLLGVDAAVFTPLLSVSVKALPLLDGARAVFFSSNNVLIDPHAEVYASLREAEAQVVAAAPDALILRPTMIYGYPGDGNLSALMTAMRKQPIAPIVGANALQQPVYYRDLARIAADAAMKDDSPRGAVSVAGPAPVKQSTLYEAVCAAAGARCAILPAPRRPLTALARIAEAVGARLPLSAAQIARAGLDKTPASDRVILTDTPLEEGLRMLAAALDAPRRGA